MGVGVATVVANGMGASGVFGPRVVSRRPGAGCCLGTCWAWVGRKQN